MSSDEQSEKECPLCMEALELDDLNFYPCKCEYQICRFCWHRIRTDENGLCPACRQPYPEDPVNFKPLSAEELQRIKSEKKHKQQQQKQKVSESRKHLANLRVLQKNLVYVIGLSPRVADPDILKKPEYFGKYGKIHKVVVGSTGSTAQSSSCTAYVTYLRPEDALRAIQNVNNVSVDGRTVKASLGTTKYCSSFLRNQPCHKQECMYLHDVAEMEASFTKEDMQQGKHTEYEKRLADQMLCQLQQNHRKQSPKQLTADSPTDLADDENCEQISPRQSRNHNAPPRHRIKNNREKSTSLERWNGRSDPIVLEENEENRSDWPAGLLGLEQPNSQSLFSHDETMYRQQTTNEQLLPNDSHNRQTHPLLYINHNGTALVNGALEEKNTQILNGGTEEPVELSGQALTETTQTDWQAAFGFKPVASSLSPPLSLPVDDDLGFDPFSESSKGLNEILEEEKRERVEAEERLSRQRQTSAGSSGGGSTFPSSYNTALSGSMGGWSERQLSPSLWQQQHEHQQQMSFGPQKSCSLPTEGLRPITVNGGSPLPTQFTTPPPAFPLPGPDGSFKYYQPNQNGSLYGMDCNGVRQPFGMGRMPVPPSRHHGGLARSISPQGMIAGSQDMYGNNSMSEWQEGLKALLPNVNVHFAPGLAPPPVKSNGPGSGWMGNVGRAGPPMAHHPPLPGPPFTQPPPPISVSNTLPCPPMRPSPPGGDPYSMAPPPFGAQRPGPMGPLPPIFPGGPWSSVTPPPPPGFSPGQKRP